MTDERHNPGFLQPQQGLTEPHGIDFRARKGLVHTLANQLLQARKVESVQLGFATQPPPNRFQSVVYQHPLQAMVQALGGAGKLAQIKAIFQECKKRALCVLLEQATTAAQLVALSHRHRSHLIHVWPFTTALLEERFFLIRPVKQRFRQGQQAAYRTWRTALGLAGKTAIDHGGGLQKARQNLAVALQAQVGLTARHLGPLLQVLGQKRRGRRAARQGTIVQPHQPHFVEGQRQGIVNGEDSNRAGPIATHGKTFGG